MTKIFVFGTLKSNRHSNYLMRESKLLEHRWLNDHALYEVGGFPAALPKEGHRVKGEVWKVTDPMVLEDLDIYEGHPDLFERSQVPGEDFEIYYYKHKVYDTRLIKSGEW